MIGMGCRAPPFRPRIAATFATRNRRQRSLAVKAGVPPSRRRRRRSNGGEAAVVTRGRSQLTLALSSRPARFLIEKVLGLIFNGGVTIRRLLVRTLRRHHHRRRPQRLDLRRLPRQGRAEDAGARAPARDRRRGGDRGDRAGLQLLGLLLLDEPAASAGHRRSRTCEDTASTVLPATRHVLAASGTTTTSSSPTTSEDARSVRALLGEGRRDLSRSSTHYLMEAARIVRRLLLETPLDPTCRDWKSFKETAKFLWKYRQDRRQAVPPRRSA